jgi:hypothetical protein
LKIGSVSYLLSKTFKYSVPRDRVEALRDEVRQELETERSNESKWRMSSVEDSFSSPWEDRASQLAHSLTDSSSSSRSVGRSAKLPDDFMRTMGLTVPEGDEREEGGRGPGSGSGLGAGGIGSLEALTLTPDGPSPATSMDRRNQVGSYWKASSASDADPLFLAIARNSSGGQQQLGDGDVDPDYGLNVVTRDITGVSHYPPDGTPSQRDGDSGRSRSRSRSKESDYSGRDSDFVSVSSQSGTPHPASPGRHNSHLKQQQQQQYNSSSGDSRIHTRSMEDSSDEDSDTDVEEGGGGGSRLPHRARDHDLSFLARHGQSDGTSDMTGRGEGGGRGGGGGERDRESDGSGKQKGERRRSSGGGSSSGKKRGSWASVWNTIHGFVVRTGTDGGGSGGNGSSNRDSSTVSSMQDTVGDDGPRDDSLVLEMEESALRQLED